MFKLGSAAVLTAAAGALLFAGAGVASADADAQGVAYGSPGVLSGNVVQVPINIPINVCGNSLNIIGALNPSFGNTCVNGDFDRDHQDSKGHDDGKGHDDSKGDDYGYSGHGGK
ncbi:MULTISPECIES: chaplin [unclassified Streptomyces]|uniref:chaplin n=1 Tax=unclassified Streptomyces TaxID=2593676 RepID=UPI002E2FCE75|nr:chaplin [Streptomyces sp. NBC_01460]WSS25853.1 chaplin [Streptomyces sp. NBC_01185]